MKLFLCLSILVLATTVLGQASVETEFNFNFKNLVQKVTTIVNAPPRNTTRSLFTAVGLFDVRGKNVASSPDQVQGAQLAFAELNEMAQRMQSGNVFRLIIKDTLAVPQNCLDIVKAAFAEGHRVFIGPTTSAELRAIQQFANDNGLVIISPSSTSADLAQIDNVFRITSSDANSVVAISRYLMNGGYTRVVPVYRNDIFGQGFYTTLLQQLTVVGISATNAIMYDDSMTAASIVARLAAVVGNSSALNSNTAIVLVSFNEWAGIVDVASALPALQNVLWIGPEFVGTPVSDRVVTYSRSAKIISVNFFVGMQNTVQIKVNTLLHAKGLASTSDSYLAYDSALLAGLASVAERREDSPIYRDSLVFTASFLYGASGRLALDAYGDRALVHTAFHMLKAQNTWALTSVFDSASVSFVQI